VGAEGSKLPAVQQHPGADILMKGGILGLLLAATVAQAAEPRLVAVLPLASSGKVDADLVRTLEEAIRTEAGDRLTPLGFTVLNGENTLSILTDNGIDPAGACEATCALDAARELKARVFLSGSITFGEGVFVAYVRLFEASSGRQLGSVHLEGAQIKVLRQQFAEKAAGLFATIEGAPVGVEGERDEATPNSTPQSSAASSADDWETVTFASEPPGAIVRIAQFPEQAKQPQPGESVVRWRLPSNRVYLVTLELPLFKAKTVSFELTHLNRKLVVPLESAFGVLSVVPVPAEAEVLIDDQPRGQGELRDWRLLAGESIELAVTHPCFYEYRKKGIQLQVGENRVERVDLRPKLVRVEVVLTNSAGEMVAGRLFVDGVEAGSTDEKHEVSICAKELKVVPDDRTLSTWTQPVTLTEGKPALYEARVDGVAYVRRKAAEASQKQARAAAEATAIDKERAPTYFQGAYHYGASGTGFSYALVIQPFAWLGRSIHMGLSGLVQLPGANAGEPSIVSHSIGGFVGYQWWLNKYFVPYGRLHVGWDLNRSRLTFLGEAGATFYPTEYVYLYGGGGYSTILGPQVSIGVGLHWLFALSLFSDARLKSDVRTVQESRYRCLGLREVTWTWNEQAHKLGLRGDGRGVLAQEVLEHVPEAVEFTPAGYFAVRYDLLESRRLACVLATR
jgi:hypothetical protein